MTTPEQERKLADRYGPPEAAVLSSTEKAEVLEMPLAPNYSFHWQNMTDQQWLKLIQLFGPGYTPSDAVFPENPGKPLILTCTLRRTRWVVGSDGATRQELLPTRA